MKFTVLEAGRVLCNNRSNVFGLFSLICILDRARSAERQRASGLLFFVRRSGSEKLRFSVDEKEPVCVG
jgi:hypothetical protein